MNDNNMNDFNTESNQPNINNLNNGLNPNLNQTNTLVEQNNNIQQSINTQTINQPVQEPVTTSYSNEINYQNSVETPKKKKSPIVLIIIIVLVVLGVGGFFLFRNLDSSSDIDESKISYDSVEYETLKKYYEKKYNMVFTEYPQGVDMTYLSGSNDNDDKIFIEYYLKKNSIGEIKVDSYSKEKDYYEKFLIPFLNKEDNKKKFDNVFRMYEKYNKVSYKDYELDYSGSGDSFTIRSGSGGKDYYVVINDVDDFDITFLNNKYNVKFDSSLFNYNYSFFNTSFGNENATIFYELNNSSDNYVSAITYEKASKVLDEIGNKPDSESISEYENILKEKSNDGLTVNTCSTYKNANGYYVSCSSYNKLDKKENCSGSVVCSFFVTKVEYSTKDKEKRDSLIETAKSNFKKLLEGVTEK